MGKEYQLRIYQYPNGESFDWVAEYPDLPGCTGVGDTIEQAIEDAKTNKTLWMEAAKSIGKEIPLPSTSYSDVYSGKFNLRIPISLHRELALRAEMENVSLNMLCSTYLAEGLNKNKFVKTCESVKIVAPTVSTKTSNIKSDWKTNFSAKVKSNPQAC